MAVIEQFLGQRVDLPEDRRYAVKQGLWAKPDGQTILFGLTQAALILSGGLKDIDWLVGDGGSVNAGESVIFAITGKILYMDVPIGGTIQFNPDIPANPALVAEDPYHKGWLYRVTPRDSVDSALAGLADARAYVEALKSSDGFKNPKGLKGGVSGICKAVYTGIGGQKIQER